MAAMPVPASPLALLLSLALFLNRWRPSAGAGCAGAPSIFIDPDYGPGTPGVYFYNAAGSLESPGSLVFLNERGQILDCINATNFELALEGVSHHPVFDHAFVGNGSLVAASIKVTDHGPLTYNNNWRWIFFDTNFRRVEGVPDLAYSGFEHNTATEVFGSDDNVWPQDLVLLKDGVHAVMLIAERRRVNVTAQFSNAHLAVVDLVDVGLRIVNRSSLEVVAEVSGFDFFTTNSEDAWADYLSADRREQLRRSRMPTFQLNDVSAVEEVDGLHWGASLAGNRTFLVTHPCMETIDLFVWNFEFGTGPEFVWRLPGAQAPRAIRKAWEHKWHLDFDPLGGFSGPLDATTENVIPYHILVYDDGRSHLLDRGDGQGCPMSRVVEYHVDLDVNGPGFHSAELAFTYPPLGQYPPVVAPTKKKGKGMGSREQRKLCEEFWIRYNFQTSSGHVGRTKAGTTIISQHGDGRVLGGNGRTPYVQVLLEVGEFGRVVTKWNAAFHGHSHKTLGRIQYIDPGSFQGSMLIQPEEGALASQSQGGFAYNGSTGLNWGSVCLAAALSLLLLLLGL